MRKHDRIEVMFEEMQGDIKAILEIVAPMRQEVTEMKMQVALIPDIIAEIQTIKLALRDTNTQVHDHEVHITHLETSRVRPA